MSEIQRSLDRFLEALRIAKATLDHHKQDVESISDRVFESLREADHSLSELVKLKSGSAGLQQQIGTSLQMLRHSIGACSRNLEEKSRIREALQNVDEESRAIVIVFGRTNAGKSTLGNFLRGKSLRNAPFANPWKTGEITPGPIKIVEIAGEGASEREWFEEGASETTREIQCFTLPGLLWVDTPGIGSVNDETLGEIARKYVDNADLVIYLDHSDNPGLTSISDNLVRLLENGQETLIVINQSDKTELVKDANNKTVMENGKPKKRRIPKSDADRRAQEQQEINSLRDRGFKTTGSLTALSISMLLAKIAIEENADSFYAGSAFGKFLEQLSGIIGSERRIRKLIGRHLYSACLDLCNMCLKGPGENIPGLQSQLENMRKFLDRINNLENDFDIEAEVDAIARRIALDTAPEVRKLVNEHEARMHNSKNIDLNIIPLLEKIQKHCNELVSERITALVKELFESVQFQTIVLEARQFADLRLERRTEVHEYEVPKSYNYERDPEGLIEHLCSFLGKKYYGIGRTTEKRTLEIDLGFNLEEVQGNIAAHLGELIPGTVEASLSDAKKQTLDYAREKVENALAILKGAERKINLVRMEIEKEMKS